MTGRYLIAAILLFAAPNLFAGEIEVVQLNNFLLEVRGGSGANAWSMRYGTQTRPSEFKTLAGPGAVAYFSHYNWLRRIDTEKGVVTGRWMFPGRSIQSLSWSDGRLQVEILANNDFSSEKSRIYEFDPDHPPVSNSIFSEASRAEALRSFSRLRFVKPQDAEKIIPELENTLRRDPFSPWLRVGLGRLYQATGRPGSEQMMEAAARLDTAHLSELFDIANYLAEIQQLDTARIAFERAYVRLWQQGQDPRLVSAPVVSSSIIQPDTPVAVQREVIARAHAINPWVDGAANAWERYGNYLVSKGETQEGNVWLARAEEARNNALLLNTDDRYFDALAASLLGTTFLAGAILYAGALFFRYRPQRRARLQAEISAGVSRPGFCNVEYWRRSERVSFLLLVACAWLVEGYAGASILASSGRSISFFYDMRAGSLLSQNAIETLETRLAASPERSLILGVAYQRDGQLEKAEQLYRSAPEFAESWNNLGVLLKSAGNEVESRKAFERALELRPDFPEAEWNLGKPARGEWVKFHAQYAPDKAMATVPTRVQMLSAYGIKEGLPEWTAIARGPLESGTEQDYYYQGRGRLRKGLLIFCAAGGLLLVFFRPREVVVAPPKYQLVLELLFPGTARIWGILGALVLGVGCYFSSAIWPERWARFYSYFSFGSITRRFPLPFELFPANTDGQQTFTAIPSFWWLVALLAVNAAAVLLWKWTRK